jgi:uncharacterized membrane protein YeaQ/YmgE (transglycosylase-associated protein family)
VRAWGRHIRSTIEGRPKLVVLIVVVIGLGIGAVLCLPRPRKGPRGCALSLVLGALGAVVGSRFARAIGAGEIGPGAELFFSVVGSVLAVAAYHASTSARSPLR